PTPRHPIAVCELSRRGPLGAEADEQPALAPGGLCLVEEVCSAGGTIVYRTYSLRTSHTRSTNFCSAWHVAGTIPRLPPADMTTSPTYKSPRESRQRSCGAKKSPGAVGLSPPPQRASSLPSGVNTLTRAPTGSAGGACQGKRPARQPTSVTN